MAIFITDENNNFLIAEDGNFLILDEAIFATARKIYIVLPRTTEFEIISGAI